MPNPQLIYFGPPDVASAVFQQYMHLLGYSLELLTDPRQLFESVQVYPAAIVILAMPDLPERLVDLARQLRQCAPASNYPIFILAHETFEISVPEVEMIWRPHALSLLAERIRKMTLLPGD